MILFVFLKRGTLKLEKCEKIHDVTHYSLIITTVNTLLFASYRILKTGITFENYFVYYYIEKFQLYVVANTTSNNYIR